MTTKKDAALDLLGLAREIDLALAGDEEADGWVLRILWLIRDLYPGIEARGGTVARVYSELLLGNGERSSRETKIRALIEHPATPGPERENAVRRLAALRSKRRAD
jgi:hypothetical protein